MARLRQGDGGGVQGPHGTGVVLLINRGTAKLSKGFSGRLIRCTGAHVADGAQNVLTDSTVLYSSSSNKNTGF